MWGIDNNSPAELGIRPLKFPQRYFAIATRDLALWFWSPNGRSNLARLRVLALQSVVGVGYFRVNSGHTTDTSSAFVCTSNTSASSRRNGGTPFLRHAKSRCCLAAKRMKNPLRPRLTLAFFAAAWLDHRILCSGLHRGGKEKRFSPRKLLPMFDHFQNGFRQRLSHGGRDRIRN